jgi:RNA polymerase sigma-70 factor (ECF subfamily)
MRNAFIFSLAFTLQQAPASELAYLALARFLTLGSRGDYIIYVVVGVAMLWAAHYIRGGRLPWHVDLHLHHRPRPNPFQASEAQATAAKVPDAPRADRDETHLHAHAHGGVALTDSPRWPEDPCTDCHEPNLQDPRPWMPALHGFIAGWGFGAFAIIVYTVLAPSMPSAAWGWVPGALFGLGTTAVQVMVGGLVGWLVRRKGASPTVTRHLGLVVAARTLGVGGIAFVVGGLFGIALPTWPRSASRRESTSTTSTTSAFLSSSSSCRSQASASVRLSPSCIASPATRLHQPLCPLDLGLYPSARSVRQWGELPSKGASNAQDGWQDGSGPAGRAGDRCSGSKRCGRLLECLGHRAAGGGGDHGRHRSERVLPGLQLDRYQHLWHRQARRWSQRCAPPAPPGGVSYPNGLPERQADEDRQVWWSRSRLQVMDIGHEQAVATGSDTDFGALVTAEMPGLYRYAVSIVGDRARAEDLVSDTVVRALQHRRQYRADASLRTWLHRILYHLAVDRGRHSSHEVSVAEVEDLWRDDSYSVDPSTALERAQSADFVRDALVHLPQAYRSVVVLHDAEGWPSSEIAHMLDISLAATKQRLRRGRMMLVSALAEGEERRMANKGVPLSCWDARQQVSDYLDDELSAADRTLLEAHLGGCATCPPLYHALVSVTASLGALHDPDSVIPATLAQRVRERVGAHPVDSAN